MFDIWFKGNASGYPAAKARSMNDAKEIIRAWYPTGSVKFDATPDEYGDVCFYPADSDVWAGFIRRD